MIFGGWNYDASDSVQKLKNDIEISKISIENSETNEVLPRSDFFVVNGTEVDNDVLPHIKLLQGHQDIIQCDTQSEKFDWIKCSKKPPIIAVVPKQREPEEEVRINY